VQLLLYDSLLAYTTTACIINLVMLATVVTDYVRHGEMVVLYLYLPAVVLDMLCVLCTLRLLGLLRSCVSPAHSLTLALVSLPVSCCPLARATNVRGQKPASARRFAEGGVETHRWLHPHGRGHGARSSVAETSAFMNVDLPAAFAPVTDHVRPFHFITPRLPLQAALAFLHSVLDAE
jgi:hypothetical protein